jgi:spectrin alpha
MFHRNFTQEDDPSQLSFSNSTDDIQTRRSKVFAAWQDFKNTASQRRAKLEDSKRLQQFLRDCDELEAWINQKLQVATDESYKDPSNLQVGQTLKCIE